MKMDPNKCNVDQYNMCYTGKSTINDIEHFFYLYNVDFNVTSVYTKQTPGP